MKEVMWLSSQFLLRYWTLLPLWIRCFPLILKFVPAIALLHNALLLLQPLLQRLNFPLFMPVVFQLRVWSPFPFPQRHWNLLKIKKAESLCKTLYQASVCGHVRENVIVHFSFLDSICNAVRRLNPFEGENLTPLGPLRFETLFTHWPISVNQIFWF